MNNYIFKIGSTGKSVTIRIVDNTTGLPDDTILYSTAGLSLSYRRNGANNVTITPAVLATPALSDPWLSGGFLLIGNGYYRVDVPDAAFVTGADQVLIHGTVTGKTIMGANVQLETKIVSDLQDLSSAQVTAAVPTAAEIRTEIDSNSTQLALILEDTGTTIPGLIDAVPTVNEILAGLNAGAYDGKTFTELMTVLRGLGFGNIAVTDNGDGTWNVILYAADGTTAVATFTTSKTTGARTIV